MRLNGKVVAFWSLMYYTASTYNTFEDSKVQADNKEEVCVFQYERADISLVLKYFDEKFAKKCSCREKLLN